MKKWNFSSLSNSFKNNHKWEQNIMTMKELSIIGVYLFLWIRQIACEVPKNQHGIEPVVLVGNQGTLLVI